MILQLEVENVRANEPLAMSQLTPCFGQGNMNQEETDSNVTQLSRGKPRSPAPFLHSLCHILRPTVHDGKTKELPLYSNLRTPGGVSGFRKKRDTRSICPQVAVYSFGHACQDVAPFSKWESSWLSPHQSPAEAREAGADGSWTTTVANGWLARLILKAPDAPLTWFHKRKHLLS